MKKAFFPQNEISHHHPKGMLSYTDREYANFAGILTECIKHCGITDISASDKKNIVVNLTLYLEDIISDAGIWRSFTDKMYDMYGKYLPFYELGNDYMRDEPNMADVAFIVWYTLVRHRDENGRGVTNPETPALIKMAADLYDVASEWFERLPVNEELADYFHDAPFLDDFYEQRNLLQWLCYDCYLTYIPQKEECIRYHAEELTEMLQDEHSARFTAACVLPYTEKIGPLACLSQDWLAMILHSNGMAEKALMVSQQHSFDIDVWGVTDSPRKQGMELQNADEDKGFIAYKHLGDSKPSDKQKICNLMVGCVVAYRNEWYTNGNCMFIRTATSFLSQAKATKKMKQKLSLNIKVGKRLLKESGGNPFFYFGNKNDLIVFLKNNMKLAQEAIDTLCISNGSNFILGIMEDGKNFYISAESAQCFYDSRNPFYDPKKAQATGFDAAMHLPAKLLEYAVTHEFLPDVGLKSVFGEQRGKQLFKENYDILQRALMGMNYC